MLLAGVPMLLFASHLEQYLLALRVQQLGAGEVVSQEQQAPDFAKMLRQLLDSNRYREQAQAFAQRHAGFSSDALVSGICDRIEEILAK
jgi:UDP:flavonoid glycosyltransferase YjiC (YdhE family)